MMKATAVLAILSVPAAFGQMAVSVQSGLVHHYEGDVQLQGQPLKKEVGKFQMVKQGQSFATTQGRAELLLTPGVFLRLAPSSSIQMISTALTDTKVQLVKGSAMVEVAELGKENKIALKVGDSETELQRAGLYEFTAEPGRVRVYDGKAQVSLKDGSVNLGRGREVMLVSGLTAGKFNLKDTDGLYEWTAMRSGLIAQANVAAASSLNKQGYRMNSSLWAWFPGLGMVTFMPRSGYIRSPFGWSYYSPASVWQFYAPRYNRNDNWAGSASNGGGGGGWSGMSRSSGNMGMSSSSGYSGDTGARAAAPAPAAAPAVSAPSGGRGR